MKKIINHLPKGLKKKLRSKFLVCFLLVFTCYWVLVALAHAQTEGEQCSPRTISGPMECIGHWQNNGTRLICDVVCAPLSSPEPTSNPGQSTITPPLAPPTSSSSNDVTAPSLNDDFRVVDASNKALLPPELYLTPSPTPGGPPTPTPSPVQVGVSNSFIENILKLTCSIPLINSFCPKNVNLATEQTTIFANQSANLTNAEKPTELQITPAKKDDRLEDVTDDTGNPSTGNEKINQVNKSLGADQGFYAVDIPQFEELKADKYNNDDPKSPFNDPASPFYQSEQDKKKNNLQLDNTPFDQDLRVPETNTKQILFNKAHYPEGMKPF